MCTCVVGQRDLLFYIVTVRVKGEKGQIYNIWSFLVVFFLQENESLEAQNITLKSDVERLEREKKRLAEVLRLHEPTCAKKRRTTTTATTTQVQKQQQQKSSTTTSSSDLYSCGESGHFLAKRQFGISYLDLDSRCIAL